MIESLEGVSKGATQPSQPVSDGPPAPISAAPPLSADYLRGIHDLHMALADEFMGAPQTMQGQMTLARVTKHVQRLTGGE